MQIKFPKKFSALKVQKKNFFSLLQKEVKTALPKKIICKLTSQKVLTLPIDDVTKPSIARQEGRHYFQLILGVVVARLWRL